MKILIFLFILTASFTIKAQNEEETINWINAKKIDKCMKILVMIVLVIFDREMISSYKFPDTKKSNNDELLNG